MRAGLFVQVLIPDQQLSQRGSAAEDTQTHGQNLIVKRPVAAECTKMIGVSRCSLVSCVMTSLFYIALHSLDIDCMSLFLHPFNDIQRQADAYLLTLFTVTRADGVLHFSKNDPQILEPDILSVI